MPEDINKLISEKNKSEFKEKVSKIVDEYVQIMRREQLTFREGMVVSDILKNTILQKGSDYLNEKFISSIEQNV